MRGNKTAVNYNAVRKPHRAKRIAVWRDAARKKSCQKAKVSAALRGKVEVSMFEGPRVFFAGFMWVGWAIVALGLYTMASGTSFGPAASRAIGWYLIGGGIGLAAFCMIGRMIASIGQELVALRQAVQDKK